MSLARDKGTENIDYGRVASPRQLGRLYRQARKGRGLTLTQVYEATALSTRFLSEFERGKENASIGRVIRALQALGLDLLVVPRGEVDRIVADLRREDEAER